MSNNNTENTQNTSSESQKSENSKKAEKSSPPSKRNSKAKKDENEYLLIGRQPDFEVRVTPRWIFVSADGSYLNPQYSYVTLTNRDATAVAFRLRTKSRDMFLISPSHGFLEAHEAAQVAILLTPASSWLNEPNKLVGRVHKLVVENTLVHDDLLLPEAWQERTALARRVFVSTRRRMGNRGGELNIYTKMRVFLPAFDFDGSGANSPSNNFLPNYFTNESPPILNGEDKSKHAKHEKPPADESTKKDKINNCFEKTNK